jgi:hypothetical protein
LKDLQQARQLVVDRQVSPSIAELLELLVYETYRQQWLEAHWPQVSAAVVNMFPNPQHQLPKEVGKPSLELQSLT